MAKTPKSSADTEEAKVHAFDAFLAQMAKEHPGEVLRLDDEGARVNIAVIPTGAISLDVAIGAGGFPRGRIVELYGPEGGGKTTLALEVAANCQAMGGYVGFVDAEHALNRELCQNVGVDERRFVVNQPDSGEKGIAMVEDMLKSRAFDMIVVDSVAALVPQAELDADVEQQHMGLHARLMSKFMRRVAGLVNETDTTLVLINQVRAALGSYGAPDTSTGGRAIKFYASLRIEVRTSASKKIERNKQIVGTKVTATVKKNKLGPPFRIAEYDVIFGQGIDGSGALLDVAENLGVVLRAGASYTEVSTGERIGVGKENVKEIVRNDAAVSARIEAAVYAALNAAPAGIASPDEEMPVELAEDLGEGPELETETAA